MKTCKVCDKVLDPRSKTGLCAAHFDGFWLRAPADLADKAKVMQIRQLAEHYKISQPTMVRICRDAGIVPLRWVDICRQRRQAKEAEKQAAAKRIDKVIIPNANAPLAAQRLQRIGEVVRCDQHGKLKHDGNCYRVWGKVMTPDEVVDLAVKRTGFRPVSILEMAA